VKKLIELLRPYQYIKNFFIFAPLIFGFRILDIGIYIDTLITFILFSLVSSSIYIFNDLNDIEEDRKHPSKRFRPLANGDINEKDAKILFITISSITLLISFKFNFQLFIVLWIYFTMNICYSLKLKHISIVDISIIAIGFILRLFAGSIVTGIELSHWIIIMTFLLAIFLALAKRRDDVLLTIAGDKTRKNINGYNLEFINASMVLMSGVVIVSYILYTISTDVVLRVGTDYLYISSLFVIIGILRYMQITFVEQKSGNPTKILLKDRFLQINILFWLSSFIAIIKLL
jgi:4-hydroxybenzoate polyprenyltransferase